MKHYNLTKLIVVLQKDRENDNAHYVQNLKNLLEKLPPLIKSIEKFTSYFETKNYVIKKHDLTSDEVIDRKTLPLIYKEPVVYREIIETYIRQSNVILEEATFTLRNVCKTWKCYIDEHVSIPDTCEPNEI